MANVINHVQGDLRPRKVLTITDEDENPVDLTVGGISTIRMHMRESGSDVLHATVPCTMLTGLQNADGTVNSNAPYNVAGKGGRIQVEWTTASVATAGKFEGEIELVYGDGTTQTTYGLIPITIRSQIG